MGSVPSNLQFVDLRADDLRDPRLVRLNALVRDIIAEIQRLGGLHGAVAIGADLDLQGHALRNAKGIGSSGGAGSFAPALTFLAAPVGADGEAAFRRITSKDLPYFDASNIVSGTFKLAQIPDIPKTKLTAVLGAGTTADRPTSPSLGFQYFDTTLGKPVWFKGPGWVAADGSAA